LRQIDIARSERAADFTLGDVAIKACGERLVGDSDRIVRCRKALRVATPPRTKKAAAIANKRPKATATAGWRRISMSMAGVRFFIVV
jgi:hypothetical protein